MYVKMTDHANTGTLFPRPLHPAKAGNIHGLSDISSSLATINFCVPEKRIKSPDDMTVWQSSKAYEFYMRFLVTLNNSVVGRGMTAQCHISPLLQQIIGMLGTFDQWIDETPAIDQPQRFGNIAFRTWHAKLAESAEDLIKTLLPLPLEQASVELTPYLVDSFGNATRIDYGTGHEASFCMFLTCLYLIGLLKKEDCVAVVNKLFLRYIEVVRRLQSVYNMEPAGSHGVWSLDDYHFVPFILGSAQLVNHPSIEPRQLTDNNVIQQYQSEFLFFNCIAQISRVKTGPFAEHSNQLWNISALPSWSKINSGLLKMYKGEVLAKFPVAQHFLFGRILPFENK